MKKFKFYKHLRSLGITEPLAISMTEQATNREKYVTADWAIIGFTTWQDTREGDEYWGAKRREYAQEGQ